MITEPQLPWEYKLLAYVEDQIIIGNTALIITQREHAHHPYTLHRMALKTGNCYYGHYFFSYEAAQEDLIDKLAPTRRGETEKGGEKYGP